MPRPTPPPAPPNANDPNWIEADAVRARQFTVSEQDLDRTGPPSETAQWRAAQQARLDQLPDLAMVRLEELLLLPGAVNIAIIGTRLAGLDLFRKRLITRLGRRAARGQRGDLLLADGSAIRFDHVGRGSGGLDGFRPHYVFADLDVPYGVLRSLVVQTNEIIPWA